jgi:PAS domain S-box-containing protein
LPERVIEVVSMKEREPTREDLAGTIRVLEERLREAEQTIEAIQSGEVDALVVSRPDGEQLYTLTGADHGYRILVESITEGALILSSDDSIYYCNRTVGEMLRLPIQKIISKKLDSYVAPDGRAQLMELIKHSRDFGAAKGELLMKRSDGALLPVNVSLNCMRVGDFEGVCAVITDLTEQKQVQEELRVHRTELERLVTERTADLARSNTRLQQEVVERQRAEEELRESEERYRSFFENSLDGIMVTAPDGTILAVNPEGCRMLGYGEDERGMLGRDGLLDTGDPRFVRFTDEQFRKGRYRGELTFIRKDGSRFPAQISASVFKDRHGCDVGTISIRDITEQKQMEQSLREANNELESRVRERTAELRITNKALTEYSAKLELLNERLQEFAFVASHDLQEPLRKIQTFGDLLAKDFKDVLGENGRDYLSRMTRAANRMSELIRSLLDYSRIGTRANPFEPVDLAKTVQDVVSDLELVIKKAGGRVEIGEMPLIDADPVQMRQLFQNIVGNSIKYCRDGEEPVVKIHGHSAGGVCRIFVEDNGIGFDEHYVDRIFKPFQRLHGKSANYEGTGMGLAICRKIVECHGGSITATSAPGEGATFIIQLPGKQSSGKES